MEQSNRLKICDCTIEEIHAKSERIFSAYGVTLKRGKGKCPFHDDSNPSFVAKPDKQGRWFWKCMTCETTGQDIISFVAKKEGYDPKREFQKAAILAGKIAGARIVLEDEDGNEYDEEGRKMEKGEERTAPTCTMPEINRLHYDAPSAPSEPPHYFDAESRMMAEEVEQTNLFKYLSGLWDATEVRRVLKLYMVGRGHYINAPHSQFNPSDEWRMNPRPCRLQNSLASSSFPSIDKAGNVHAIKIIPYPATDHHRIKDAQPDKAQMYWIKPEQNPGAYFGTHLLAHDPDKPLAIVESEKSAIIGTLYAPQYTWIAVQSLSEFKPGHKMDALTGRTLHIFPDADAMEKWKEIADGLRNKGYSVRFRDEVMRMFPAESKLDIGDIIVWEMERRANNG